MKTTGKVMLCFLVLSLALLTACSSGGSGDGGSGGGGNSGGNSTANDSAGNGGGQSGTGDVPEKVTISIYYPTPDRVEDRALEDDKIRRFQEMYPHVEIIKSDWQYDPNEIGIRMGANEAPTLFNTYATEGKFLMERGWAADITEFFNEWEYHDQMNPILQNQFIIDGKVYGLAQRGYVVATVVNKKMLNEAGVDVPPFNWTWDDMYNTAQAVADPAKGLSGIALMGKGNEAGWNWTNFLFEAGGEIQKIDNGKVIATFHSEAGLEALKFYHRLRWEANAIPQDWALGWGDAVGAFAQGRTAMVIAGADGPVDQALNQGGMSPDDIEVFPMPAYRPGGKHTGVLGGDFLVINPNATRAEQEMAFKYAVFDYFSDKGLESLEASIQERKQSNKYFIPPVIEYFNMDSEYGQKVKAIYEKYDNVYQYKSEVLNLLDGKPEAQFNTQDYYAAMTNAIQEVFSNKDADLEKLLKETAEFVQANVFDSIQVQ